MNTRITVFVLVLLTTLGICSKPVISYPMLDIQYDTYNGLPDDRLKQGTGIDFAWKFLDGLGFFMLEDSANGTNYHWFRPAQSIASNFTTYWPDDNGSADQYLMNDGAGNMSWEYGLWVLSGSQITQADTSNNVFINLDATSGAGLYLERSLASGSTNNAMLRLSQANSLDDQPAIWVQQVGSSASATGILSDSEGGSAYVGFNNDATVATIKLKNSGGGPPFEMQESVVGSADSIFFSVPIMSADYELVWPTDEGTAGYVLSTDGNNPAQLSWVSNAGGGGGMTDWLVDADSGGPKTIADGETLDIEGGTNGIDTAASGASSPFKVTLNFDPTEVNDVTWGDTTGAGGLITWIFDQGGATDPQVQFRNGQIQISNIPSNLNLPDGGIVMALDADIQGGDLQDSAGPLKAYDTVLGARAGGLTTQPELKNYFPYCESYYTLEPQLWKMTGYAYGAIAPWPTTGISASPNATERDIWIHPIEVHSEHIPNEVTVIPMYVPAPHYIDIGIYDSTGALQVSTGATLIAAAGTQTFAFATVTGQRLLETTPNGTDGPNTYYMAFKIGGDPGFNIPAVDPWGYDGNVMLGGPVGAATTWPRRNSGIIAGAAGTLPATITIAGVTPNSDAIYLETKQ